MCRFHHLSRTLDYGNPSSIIPVSSVPVSTPLSPTQESYSAMNGISKNSDKAYNLFLAELLEEYSMPHSVTCMFQQGLASNAFQKRVAQATNLDKYFKLHIGGKGPASALEVYHPSRA